LPDYNVKKGTAFHAGPDGSRHLHVVVSDPDSTGHVLILNMSTGITLPTDGDGYCVLSPGEHPFIKHQTIIRYSKARDYCVSTIIAAMRVGSFHPAPDVSATLLKKIQTACVDNPSLEERYYKYFQYF